MARTKKRYLQSQSSPSGGYHSFKTGIYTRLSKERTESWRNKSTSLENQERLGRQFASEHDLEVIKIYQDYEQTGTNFNRPGFQAMMEDIRNGVINCIVIRDLSRLGRDYVEMGRLIDKVFPFLGVRFISINDHLDTLSGLEDKKSFEVTIKNIVNDLYAKDIGQKVAATNNRQAQEGYFIGHTAPYGYQTQRESGGLRLVKDPHTRFVLEKIFELALADKSSAEICRYLNQENIAVPQHYRRTGKVYREKTDTTLWLQSSIIRLLKKFIYTGNLCQRRTGESGVITVMNTHEGYLTQEDFQTIAELQANRKSVKSTKNQLTVTPNRYKGLVYIKGTNVRLRRGQKFFTSPHGDYYVYNFTSYVLRARHPNLPKIYIGEKVLDQLVTEVLKREVCRLGGDLDELIQSLETTTGDKIAAYQKQVTHLQKHLQHLQIQLSEAYEYYHHLAITKAAFLEQKATCHAQMKTLQQEQLLAEQAIQELQQKGQKHLTWLTALKKTKTRIELSDDLLHQLIKRIEVDVDKTITVTFTCHIKGGEDHG